VGPLDDLPTLELGQVTADAHIGHTQALGDLLDRELGVLVEETDDGLYRSILLYAIEILKTLA